MRRTPLIPVLSLLLVAAPPVFGAAHLTVSSIDGSQEVPANGSAGTGSAQFIVDTATNTIFYHITFSGLTGVETAAHVHGFAPPGANAGVLFGLPLGSPKVGSATYAEAQEASILAGLTYVNIHSTFAGGGEIRGQVVVDPATDFVALIDPLQEVPPNPPGGEGIASFDLDTVGNTVAYDIRFWGLTGVETAAHIHGPAPIGANAGVLFGLPAGSPKIGSSAITEATESAILSGLTYVNIHSTFDGGGEIRGQVLPMNPATGVDAVPADRSGVALLAAPNPAPHGNVALLYSLPRSGPVTVTIHDVSGRVIRRIYDEVSAGSGVLSWDTRNDLGQDVAAGVYFARLDSREGRQTRQIVVLR
ncbi:MAG: hypothetical protein DHS20C21_14310 [Gemmatimonadota bacterium]|nr:MAG: hypothetical protein DHS20C21_14310 [Gemmatimonadota bacterium]